MRTVLVMLLCLVLTVPSGAQSCAPKSGFIATPELLAESLRSSAAEREQNLQQVAGFLRNPAVRQVLAQSRLDPARMADGAALLSDAELARLAAQSRDIERDIAAGLSKSTKLCILILVAFLIVAVVAGITVAQDT